MNQSGKKIRKSELMKIPYTIVIGEKEIASGKVIPRVRNDMAASENHEEIEYKNFLRTVANENTSRVLKSSL